MSAKSLIWLGVIVGSTVGGLMGGALDHGNFFGLWAFALSTIGAFAGIWAGFKLSQ